MRAQITVKHSMLLLMLALQGCSPLGAFNKPDLAISPPSALPSQTLLAPTELVAQSAEQNDVQANSQHDLWHRLSEGFKFAPAIENADVKREREWLQHNRVFVEEFSRNARPYLYHVATEMERQGIPAEMALIPVIESAYNATAHGGGGAGGMWQLMAGTGRTLGVRMSHQFDGRKDVVASTDGAIKYLKQLNKEFDGDWLLTIAAYNQGELFVEASLARARSAKKPTDFWSLRMPKVTRVFVPRIIALAQMIKDQNHFGLPLESIPNTPAFRQVVVQGPVDLNQLATISNSSLSTIVKLNSGYNGRFTEAGRHTILIPYATNDELLSKLTTVNTVVASNERNDKISAKKAKLAKHGKNKNQVGKTLYLVKKGDNLKTISKRFNVDHIELARWNGLKSNSALKVGQQIVIWNDG